MSYNDNSEFIPVLEIGFATKANGGYDAGGLNLADDYSSDTPSYFSQYGTNNTSTSKKYNKNTKKVKSSYAKANSRSTAANMGIFVLVAVVVAAAAYIARQKWGSEVEASQEEVDSGYVNVEGKGQQV